MQDDRANACRQDGFSVIVGDEGAWLAPLALAFDAQGEPVPVVLDQDAQETCSHEGAVYSSSLDMRCPRCGARMFLPPRFLACLHWTLVETMYQTWEDAGWPEWGDGRWLFNPPYWTVERHPLFEATSGIPVNNDRLEAWRAKWQS